MAGRCASVPGATPRASARIPTASCSTTSQAASSASRRKSASTQRWSGDVRMDTATMKEYVQFAADMGFPYQLVDWQWYGPFARPAADLTRVNPNLDFDELRRFAKERHVRLIVWLHSADVDRALRAG